MNYIGGIMKIKKESILSFAMLAASVLLVAFSSQAKEGALHGIAMAQEVVVPGLLPLLIILNVVSKTAAGDALQNLLASITERLFRLPKVTGTAIIFGLTGGYPTGALLTENLYLNGDIDAQTARRLLRFNVNGGAAFIITAVGAIVLKSQRAGVMLFASTTLAAVLIAVFSSFRYEKIKESYSGFSAQPFGDALNMGTQSAVRAVLNISAYIILFSAAGGIFEFPPLLSPLIEITGGVVDNYSMFTLPQLAFFIAFSGGCIHFQLLSIIKKIGMKYSDFLIWRLVHALVSYGVCFLLTRLFPDEIYVFSNSAESIAAPFCVNPTLSVLMVLGCAVLVFDIGGRKRRI